MTMQKKIKVQRFCSSCPNPISYRNHSGFCIHCSQRVIKGPKVVRVCKNCPTIISDNNKSGMCLSCSMKNRWANTPKVIKLMRFCKQCPNQISINSITDLCTSCGRKTENCKWPQLKYAKICKDCPTYTLLERHNKSGRCQSCHVMYIKTLPAYKLAMEQNYAKMRTAVQKYCETPDCNTPITYDAHICKKCHAKSMMKPDVDRTYEGFTNKLKEEIRNRDNNECQLCKMTNIEHLMIYNQSLPVHHIDYNKKNPAKNNLISLCHQCHMRTNYDRLQWQEYFKTNFATHLSQGVLI